MCLFHASQIQRTLAETQTASEEAVTIVLRGIRSNAISAYTITTSD
ncbi:MAG: hypothetical protein ABJC63_09315 [Gemmatimonadales bacterium]